MANKNNNTNELVSEDDPTAEFETLSVTADRSLSQVELESAADTCKFEAADSEIPDKTAALHADLQSRSETISRLQYDIEQLRSRWMGLESEIRAREQQTSNLNKEIKSLHNAVARKNKSLKSREATIKSMRAEKRERDSDRESRQQEFARLQEDFKSYRDAVEAVDIPNLRQTSSVQTRQIEILKNEKHALQKLVDNNNPSEDRRLLAKYIGRLISQQATIRTVNERFERAETYADALRRKLQTAETDMKTQHREYEQLKQAMDSALIERADLRDQLHKETKKTSSLFQQLDNLKSAHAEEIRMIRLELGEAQETIAQHEVIGEQLASELIDTRSHRSQLEAELSKSAEQIGSRIDELERVTRKQRRENRELTEKLESKNDAINCLIAELTKKSEQVESIGQIEDVIQDIDDRMSVSIEDPPPAEKERTTRLLIGSVEGQELRFPLFKNRLTIGRTEQNDIQLKAGYISRRHAVIVTEGDVTRVIDWGSKNGVFVNANRVTEHFLKNGEIVGIGTAKFRYEERPKRET